MYGGVPRDEEILHKCIDKWKNCFCEELEVDSEPGVKMGRALLDLKVG